MSDSLWSHGLQHTRLPCPLPSPRVCSNSCPLSQWCHPTTLFSFPSPLAIDLPQHRGIFQWVGSSHQVAKVLEIQHQSFQWVFRVDFLSGWLVWSLCCQRELQEFSLAPQCESINSSALSLLYSPTLTSVHDYWKNHSFDYVDLCWPSDVHILTLQKKKTECIEEPFNEKKIF